MFFIKDLKDLKKGTTRVSIDIKDLKDLKRHRLTIDNAGACPPRYGNIETRRSLLPEEIETRGLSYRKKSRPGGLSYRTHRNMKHPQLICSLQRVLSICHPRQIELGE